LRVATYDHPEKPRPDRCHGLEMSDELWELILKCWHRNATARPTPTELIQEINHITRIHLPPGLWLNEELMLQEKSDLVARGAYADVYQGIFRGELVAIKEWRVFQEKTRESMRHKVIPCPFSHVRAMQS
jgi:hypothetical protein